MSHSTRSRFVDRQHTGEQYASNEQLLCSAGSDFDSFDSQIESDVMSSLSNWQRNVAAGRVTQTPQGTCRVS